MNSSKWANARIYCKGRPAQILSETSAAMPAGTQQSAELPADTNLDPDEIDTVNREIRQFGKGMAFVSPWLIGFFVFTLLPIVVSFYFSLCKFDLLAAAPVCRSAQLPRPAE